MADPLPPRTAPVAARATNGPRAGDGGRDAMGRGGDGGGGGGSLGGNDGNMAGRGGQAVAGTQSRVSTSGRDHGRPSSRYQPRAKSNRGRGGPRPKRQPRPRGQGGAGSDRSRGHSGRKPRSTRRRKFSVAERYRVIGKIGEGTFGKVYKAVEDDYDKTVAIKNIKVVNETEGIHFTAIREVALLRELRHENIVRLLDVIADVPENNISLVFEYAEFDLAAIASFHRGDSKEHRPRSALPMVMVKSITWQLLNGLKYLHDNWVMHRDLKPANILVVGQGPEVGRIKIADFGMARFVNDPVCPYPNIDRLVTTIWYRAPELLLHSKHYTPAVDMWAVGCILGELVNLKPLFKGKELSNNENRDPFERHQMESIVAILGAPDPRSWPSIVDHPDYQTLRQFSSSENHLKRAVVFARNEGHDALSKLLTYDPTRRISAENALEHQWFKVAPLPQLCCFENQDRILYPKRKAVSEDKASSQAALPSDASATRPAKRQKTQ